MLNRFIDPSGDRSIDSLLSGIKWGASLPGSDVLLTYSFPTPRAQWDYRNPEEQDAGWWGLNATQQQSVRLALNSWSSVANINLVEVEDSTTYGDLRIAYSNAVTGNITAYAYTPKNGAYSGDLLTPAPSAGDIWINPSLTELSPGSSGYSTLIHEIGHALGLKHPFEEKGNFSTLSEALDNKQYSIMSYTAFTGAGYRYTDLSENRYRIETVDPGTPMLYDILAMQYLYGANEQHATGDNHYRFDTQAELKTIWDAGGTDTFDFSNQSLGVTADLNAGAFSSVGQRQMSYGGALRPADNNIAIAFGTEIEHAIGSAHSDQLTGNALDNRLQGGAGNDSLDGGAGFDTAVYTGTFSEYQLSAQNNVITVLGQDGTDTLVNIEQLQFDDQLLLTRSLSDTMTKAPTQRSEINFTPTEGSTAYFLLELNRPLSTAAQVHYSTRDGTAHADQDYIAVSGIAIMNAGVSSLAIPVWILEDRIQEHEETFSLVISSPEGADFPEGQLELVASRTIVDSGIIA